MNLRTTLTFGAPGSASPLAKIDGRVMPGLKGGKQVEILGQIVSTDNLLIEDGIEEYREEVEKYLTKMLGITVVVSTDVA